MNTVEVTFHLLHTIAKHQLNMVMTPKPFLTTDPKNTIASVKRFMGRSKADIKFQHPYALVGEADEMPALIPLKVVKHQLKYLLRF